MSNLKVVLNRNGVRDLLQSEEMKRICEEHAQKTLSRLGEGYVATSMVGKTRANASISADSYAARKDNSENNTILKALRG